MDCPDCGSILEILESDCCIEKFDQEKVLAYFYGYCEECKKVFIWDRIFVFDEDSNLEEVAE